jgi:MFS family permease
VWTAQTQTAAWCVIFFFASAGASAAYLTVSEIFPMETRALAIAFFHAVGTAIGGITGPLLFGKLVATKEVDQVFWGYILGAALMIGAGIVQAIIGIEAAQRNLEDVAKPLSAEAAEGAEDEQRPAAEARTPDQRRPAAQPQSRVRGRVRFGPSAEGLSWSPILQSSSRLVPDEDTDDEVAALVGALREAGSDGLERRVLGARVNCRLWGPGRYRRALGIAQTRGDIRRTGRSRFVAA